METICSDLHRNPQNTIDPDSTEGSLFNIDSLDVPLIHTYIFALASYGLLTGDTLSTVQIMQLTTATTCQSIISHFLP